MVVDQTITHLILKATPVVIQVSTTLVVTLVVTQASIIPISHHSIIHRINLVSLIVHNAKFVVRWVIQA